MQGTWRVRLAAMALHWKCSWGHSRASSSLAPSAISGHGGEESALQELGGLAPGGASGLENRRRLRPWGSAPQSSAHERGGVPGPPGAPPLVTVRRASDLMTVRSADY